MLDTSKAKERPTRSRVPNRLRTFILYMILVGLPLAGVAGALYLGERLEAPASVKGSWRVDAAAPCLAGLGETVFIAQSGPDLQLTFNAAPLTVPGQVNGLRLTATDARGTLVLEATLDQPRGAARLQGRVTAAHCAGPEDWSATRVLASE